MANTNNITINNTNSQRRRFPFIPLLLVTGLGVAAFAVYRTAQQLSELTFWPIGVRVNKSAQKIKGTLPLIFIFRIENPTNRPVNFEKFVGEIFMNGTLVGPLTVTPKEQEMIIPAAVNKKPGFMVIEAKQRITYNTLAGSLLQLFGAIFSGQSANVNLFVRGKVDAVGMNSIPFASNFQLL
jgi:hypothetical protein